MKIYNEEILMHSAKVLLSKKPFKVIHNIRTKQDVIIISPWTKNSEIFSYKKDNFLANCFNEKYESLAQEILNQEKAISIIDEIKNDYNIDIFDFDERSSKMIKDHFKINDEDFVETEIINILKFINRFARTKTQILLLGYDKYIMDIIKLNLDKIDILAIVTNLKEVKITKEYLECLMIEYGENEIFQIMDLSLLINWLEKQVEVVISEQDVEDYFNNVINDKTIFIEKALYNL